jgi:hypothetical protein
MLQLHKELVEKKSVEESTAAHYIKALYILNGKKPFKTLTFLKDTEGIQKHIAADYADTTQKTLYGALSSILSLYKEKPAYKKVYQFYYDQMMTRSKAAAEADTSQKTEKQEQNWISWEEVAKRCNDLRTDALKQSKDKTLSPDQWESLLHYIVLGLYAYIPPRRNQDYLDMRIVRAGKKDIPEEMPKEHNYLVLAPKDTPTKFIFNKYKTSKTYGQQIIAIPNTAEQPLGDALLMYLRHHPGLRDKKAKETAFLVDASGEAITAGNAITRILNKVFGKAIGSSMLRHIYLSSKYDITEMKADSAGMAHSVSQQKEYLKASEAPSCPSVPPPQPSLPSTSHSPSQTE